MTKNEILKELEVLAAKLGEDAALTMKPNSYLYQSSAYSAFRWNAEDIRSLILRAQAK